MWSWSRQPSNFTSCDQAGPAVGADRRRGRQGGTKGENTDTGARCNGALEFRHRGKRPQAVGPFVEERLNAFRREAAKLARDKRPVEARLALLQGFDPALGVLELRICDPSMGSGHFLVNLVDWLAGKALAAIEEAAQVVDGSDKAGWRALRLRELLSGTRKETARRAPGGSIRFGPGQDRPARFVVASIEGWVRCVPPSRLARPRLHPRHGCRRCPRGRENSACLWTRRLRGPRARASRRYRPRAA